jgi:hypothetical protein
MSVRFGNFIDSIPNRNSERNPKWNFVVSAFRPEWANLAHYTETPINAIPINGNHILKKPWNAKMQCR